MMRYRSSSVPLGYVSKCVQILGHLKAINFPCGTSGKLMVTDVQIHKHFKVSCGYKHTDSIMNEGIKAVLYGFSKFLWTDAW